MFSIFGGPLVVNNLTILNSKVDGLSTTFQSNPNLISELFLPRNVDFHPWEFKEFIQNPEYLRIPIAKSISISNGEGYYFLDEPISRIWGFLYDKDGYGNCSIVSFSIRDENQVFLKELVEVS